MSSSGYGYSIDISSSSFQNNNYNANNSSNYHNPNLKNKTHVSVRNFDRNHPENAIQGHSKLKVKPLVVSQPIITNHSEYSNYNNYSAENQNHQYANNNKNIVRRNASISKTNRKPPPKVPKEKSSNSYGPVTYSPVHYQISPKNSPNRRNQPTVNNNYNINRNTNYGTVIQ